MAEERFIKEIGKLPVWYGANVEKVRDLFSRKEQKITIQDAQFFSQYWQVFAWTAIIGFLNNKRQENADLYNKTSIPSFNTIYNNGEDVGQALILMAIGKIETENFEEILKPRKILNIIGEYAEGGAKHILEIRETEGNSTLFDHPDDYLLEIYNRTPKEQ
jgi:hypothetical protein